MGGRGKQCLLEVVAHRWLRGTDELTKAYMASIHIVPEEW